MLRMWSRCCVPVMNFLRDDGFEIGCFANQATPSGNIRREQRFKPFGNRGEYLDESAAALSSAAQFFQPAP